MAGYVLLWNPSRWNWSELDAMVSACARGESVQVQWSAGNARQISTGDRLFLLRVSNSFRGFMGLGTATTDCFEDGHWDSDRNKLGDKAWYVKLKWDWLINPEQTPASLLRLEEAREAIKDFPLAFFASGVGLQAEAEAELLKLCTRRRGLTVPFQVGAKYTRSQVQRNLGVPVRSGGDWATGYTRVGDDWVIFANVGHPGRTGHNYGNHWVGDDLHWRTKGNKSQSDKSVQELLRPPNGGRVFIFTREHDRDPFIFEGLGHPSGQPRGNRPVEIVWSINNAQQSGQLSRATGPSDGDLVECGRRVVKLTIHERNPAARRACLAHYGCNCRVCGFNFEATYGPIGQDFIHVHHLNPVSDSEHERTVDPVEDLRPVCPNCHSMLHSQRPPLTIEDLRSLLRI